MNTSPAPCHVRPVDTKAFIGAIGKRLVNKHGKRKFYKPRDIRRAAEQGGYGVDLHCWAYSFYATPEDFSSLHAATGEACDYVAMRTEMLASVADDASFSIFNVDLSWIELPDIDFSAIFDSIDLS